MNVIGNIHQSLNLNALGRKACNQLSLISILQHKALDIIQIQERFEVSQATAYRLISETNDLLRHHKIINYLGLFQIVEKVKNCRQKSNVVAPCSMNVLNS